MVVITSDQREIIADAVREMYTAVATRPEQPFHFPTGRRACAYVGYPEEELDRIPAAAVESFAGVGYPFADGEVEEGDTVLDIGSGSGTDLRIAHAYPAILRVRKRMKTTRPTRSRPSTSSSVGRPNPMRK